MLVFFIGGKFFLKGVLALETSRGEQVGKINQNWLLS